MATRYSWSFSSRGIPTCIWNAPSARRLSPSLGLTGQATSGHRPSLRDWRPLARAPFMGWRSARGPPPRGIRRRPAGRVRRPHASAPEPIEPEGDQRLGVAGGPGAGECERLLVGEPDDLHAGLLPVGLGAVAVDRPDALGQEQVDHLVAPAGRGVEGGEPGERAALDPQLLGQLPPQRVLDLLTADVVLAGGDLDQAPPDGVAPLVDQEDGALLVDHPGGRRPAGGLRSRPAARRCPPPARTAPSPAPAWSRAPGPPPGRPRAASRAPGPRARWRAAAAPARRGPRRGARPGPASAPGSGRAPGPRPGWRRGARRRGRRPARRQRRRSRGTAGAAVWAASAAPDGTGRRCRTGGPAARSSRPGDRRARCPTAPGRRPRGGAGSGC